MSNSFYDTSRGACHDLDVAGICVRGLEAFTDGFKSSKQVFDRTHMKIGFSTQLGLGLSLHQYMRIAATMRAEFLEIKLDDPDIQRSLRFNRIKRSKKLAESMGLRLTAHLPYIDVNLASLNPEVLQASQKTISRWIHVLDQMGVETLVAHAGKLSADYPRRYVDRARATLIEGARELSRNARRSGIIFTIENDHKRADHLIAGKATDVKQIAKRAGCGVTFDIGHANTLGRPLALVKALGSLIENVHVSDNDGNGDQHLVLGNGTVRLEQLIDELTKIDYRGPLIVEVKSMSDLRTSLARLRSVLRYVTLA